MVPHTIPMVDDYNTIDFLILVWLTHFSILYDYSKFNMNKYVNEISINHSHTQASTFTLKHQHSHSKETHMSFSRQQEQIYVTKFFCKVKNILRQSRLFYN